MTIFVARRIGFQADDFAALGPEWWSPRWSLLGLSCLALLAANLFAGVIWGVLVRDLGGPPMTAAEAVRVFALANLGRYVPGKVWQVAGLVVLAKRVGVPASVATAAAVLGHGLSLGAATLVGGPAFARVTVGAVDGRIVVAGVAIAMAVAAAPPVLRAAVSVWVRLTRIDFDVSRLSARDGARWILLLVLAWIAYGAAFTVFAASFGVTGPPLAVGPAFVAAYVLGYVAVFAPAGVGVREVALVGLLGTVAGPAEAAGIAVAARLWATAIEVLAGVAFFALGLRASRGERVQGSGS